MFQNLEIFQLSHAMARHAAKRQEAVSANMANADTPGYQPRDLEAFNEIMRSRPGTDGMRSTRAGHIGAEAPLLSRAQTETGTVSVNGNGVSLEEEMLRAVSVRRQHNRALAIYKSSLSILRASIGQR